MKAVVIGKSSGASREAIMAVYPRRKVVVDRFVARGVVLGIGPFADGGKILISNTRRPLGIIETSSFITLKFDLDLLRCVLPSRIRTPPPE